jgi:hypothetical protein
MFVYQNKDGQICVTFADNKPVETPDYVIAIDEEAKALYAVVGEVAPLPVDDADEAEADEPTVDNGDEPSEAVVDEPEVPANDEENEEV